MAMAGGVGAQGIGRHDREPILTIHVAVAFRRRGGRKRIVVPGSSPAQTPMQPGPTPDDPLAKALARAFRWRKLIEIGACATLAEIAAAESVNPSYVSRVLRLTLLAPDIVEAILDGAGGSAPTLAKLLKPFPVEWPDQHRTRTLGLIT